MKGVATTITPITRPIITMEFLERIMLNDMDYSEYNTASWRNGNKDLICPEISQT